jgi:hypothetical protein
LQNSDFINPFCSENILKEIVERMHGKTAKKVDNEESWGM